MVAGMRKEPFIQHIRPLMAKRRVMELIVSMYVVLKTTDATGCGAGVEECYVEPEEVGRRYLEQFGKKIGFVDLSIFMDGTD